MGVLSLTLDYGLKRVVEPGFHRTITDQQIAYLGTPKQTDGSMNALWADPATNTIMLRPLQLRPDWLGTTRQLPYVVRINQLNINATDLANKSIHEDAAFGNTADPWIYHQAVGPTSFFPTAARPGEEFPESPPSVVGIGTTVDPTHTDLLTIRPNAIFQQPSVLPDPTVGPPAPVQIGSTTDGRHIAESLRRFPANQGFYVRWYHPPSRIGFPITYVFYVGQFRLDIKDVVVQIFQDIGPQGDRQTWKHVATAPLFTVGDYSITGIRANWAAIFHPQEILAHDRSLMFLPFRRNQILLLASTGKYHLLQVKPRANRLPDNSDWDITRSDSVMVWVLSPSWGRFQIQTLAYVTGDVLGDLPTVTADYIPSVAPTATLVADTDHGTHITANVSQPAAYTIPENNAEDCPKVPANIATIQARTYGLELVFNTPDNNWTPFLYAVDFGTDEILGAPITTPTTVADSGSGTRIVSAEYSLGIAPGEGRAKVEVLDLPASGTYPLAGFYYRCGQPMQLTLDGTALFTGITQPQEVVPLKQNNTMMRRIVFTALDRWAQLEATWLRDQRFWAGKGHIDVVASVLRQAGVDTTVFNTPPVNAQYNTPLGGPTDDQTVAQNTRLLEPGWKPRAHDTAASFIRRIAQNFSGWDFGFYADGTPFYYPKQYFTTPEFTFYESKAAATAAGAPTAPLYRAPVSFQTIEPEANVILVKAASSQDGSPLYSSVWTDFASILNKDAVNFLGRRKVEIIELSGTYTCSQLNWAARKIWDRTRRRWITARFDADYTSQLKQGHAFTLHPYGNYRCISLTGHMKKRTWDTLTVEAEFIETGFGLSTGAVPV